MAVNQEPESLAEMLGRMQAYLAQLDPPRYVAFIEVRLSKAEGRQQPRPGTGQPKKPKGPEGPEAKLPRRPKRRPPG